MSKRQFKSQASSGRVGAAFGGFGSPGFGSNQSSVLSYIQEPPDYSSISDANVVVSFKNLSKKDGTTKAKALEDLQSYVNSTEFEIEESFLEAWVGLSILGYGWMLTTHNRPNYFLGFPSIVLDVYVNSHIF